MAPRQQPVLGVPERPGPRPISETVPGAPRRRGCFTVSSGNVRADPFDSVNHFLECKTVKGRSYSFPIPLIARIDRHHRFEWRNSLQVTFRKNHGDQHSDRGWRLLPAGTDSVGVPSQPLALWSASEAGGRASRWSPGPALAASACVRSVGGSCPKTTLEARSSAFCPRWSGPKRSPCAMGSPEGARLAPSAQLCCRVGRGLFLGEFPATASGDADCGGDGGPLLWSLFWASDWAMGGQCSCQVPSSHTDDPCLPAPFRSHWEGQPVSGEKPVGSPRPGGDFKERTQFRGCLVSPAGGGDSSSIGSAQD